MFNERQTGFEAILIDRYSKEELFSQLTSLYPDQKIWFDSLKAFLDVSKNTSRESVRLAVISLAGAMRVLRPEIAPQLEQIGKDLSERIKNKTKLDAYFSQELELARYFEDKIVEVIEILLGGMATR